MRKIVVGLGLISLILFTSCQHVSWLFVSHSSRTRNTPSPKNQQEKLLTAIDSILSVLDSPSDSVAFSHAYRKGQILLDSLQQIPSSNPVLDSLLDVLAQRIAQVQDENAGASDSLAGASILKELHLENVPDTTLTDSTVSIGDVMQYGRSMQIPLTLNEKVKRALQYFTQAWRGRRVMQIWLQRSRRYEKLIKSILRQEGVPEELFYLAMIESGFNPHARSYARAVGIWQFIASTARAYGLRFSWWFDERRDPVKATRAAAHLLKDLYQLFGDWYLAMAGYNYSPGKIQRRLVRQGVDDYWSLSRLPRQTRNYIPTFIAAATIAQNPEKYGFHIPPGEPLEFDTVTVHECVDLNVVASCVGHSFQEIKKLNPALLRWCTPPDVKKWTLYLPKGTREQFLRNYARIPDRQKRSYIRHRIRYGETLSTIARRYGVSIGVIKQFNHIRGMMIRAGDHLIIPVPQNKAYYRMTRRSHRKRHRRIVTHVPGHTRYTYRVREGDTLWDIARQWGVTVPQLRRWNGLGHRRIIRPGQKLYIWLPKGTSPPQILAEENIPSHPRPLDPTSWKTIYYTVREGDTLWDIARRFGVRIYDIKKWNGIKNSLIHPGKKLKILIPIYAGTSSGASE